MRNLSVIKGLYQGNGVTRRWAIPFEYNDTAQIFVTITTFDEGDYTYRVLDSTEYTIDEDSVEIVYPKTVDDEPIPSTQYLTVWRDTDLLQLMDLTNQGAAWPDSIEASLDKLHQIVQELAEGLSRSLKVDIGDPQTPDEKLVAIQDYVLAAAESSRSASESEASAQRSAEAAATSEANAAESERLAGGYADTATAAASRAEDSAISARAYNAPDYDNETTYQAGDVVTYTDGNSYRALQETTGNEPPNIIYWQKVTDYVGDDFFEVDEYGYIVPMDSPSHSRYWRVDQDGYIVPIEGGDGGYRPDTRSLSAEYLNVTNEGYVKHLRADDIAAQDFSATGNVTAGMLTTPQANVTTLTANAVNAGNVTKVLNTVNDMLSDNLSVGMTARTLGYYAVDDGCGETYVITNSADNVDGDKIIQLNNGLYAKRITQSDLPDFFLGAFFTSNTDEVGKLYTSIDGINFQKMHSLENIMRMRDTSIRYYKNNFYMVRNAPNENTFILYKSHDLKNWTNKEYKVIERNNMAVYAPDLFIDDDGSAYVYFALQWGTEQVGIATTSLPGLDMWVSKCNDIEDAAFQSAVSMDLPKFDDPVTVIQNNNNIDGFVEKINNVYYLIVKNEHQPSVQNDGGYLGLNLHLLKSNNPMTNWTEITTFPLQYNRGVEGPCIVVKNDMVYIFADCYQSTYNIPQNNQDSYGGVWVWKTRIENLETGPYELEAISSTNDLRHGSVINIESNYAKRVIESFGVISLGIVSSEATMSRRINLDKYNGYEASADLTAYKITNFAPVQDTLYIVSKGYIEIDGVKNVNSAKDFYIQFKTTDTARIRINHTDVFWIGNDRLKNGQLLHFVLNGNELRYCGTLNDLIGSFANAVSTNYARLCKFTFASDANLYIKLRAYSASNLSNHDKHTSTHTIRINRISNNTYASIVNSEQGEWARQTRLIKTGDYDYEFWCYQVDQKMAIEVLECRVSQTQNNIYSIISFEPQILTNWPSGTIIEPES